MITAIEFKKGDKVWYLGHAFDHLVPKDWILPFPAIVEKCIDIDKYVIRFVDRDTNEIIDKEFYTTPGDNLFMRR